MCRLQGTVFWNTVAYNVFPRTNVDDIRNFPQKKRINVWPEPDFSHRIIYRSPSSLLFACLLTWLPFVGATFRVHLTDFQTFAVNFEETDIIANAFFMFAGGFETVSTAMTFCLYELALQKCIQDRVRDEMIVTKAKHGGELNNEFLTDLHYLEMVLAGQYSIIL